MDAFNTPTSRGKPVVIKWEEFALTITEELDAAFKNQKTPKQALDDAAAGHPVRPGERLHPPDQAPAEGQVGPRRAPRGAGRGQDRSDRLTEAPRRKLVAPPAARRAHRAARAGRGRTSTCGACWTGCAAGGPTSTPSTAGACAPSTRRPSPCTARTASSAGATCFAEIVEACHGAGIKVVARMDFRGLHRRAVRGPPGLGGIRRGRPAEGAGGALRDLPQQPLPQRGLRRPA